MERTLCIVHYLCISVQLLVAQCNPTHLRTLSACVPLCTLSLCIPVNPLKHCPKQDA